MRALAVTTGESRILVKGQSTALPVAPKTLSGRASIVRKTADTAKPGTVTSTWHFGYGEPSRPPAKTT